MVAPLVLPRLYVLADDSILKPEGLPSAVEAMVTAGVQWIQLRVKQATDRVFFSQVESCLQRLGSSETALWINDRPDIAASLPVAGVHLGQDDLPPAAARQIVGPDRWIGRSTHSVEQAVEADADDAVDVIAFGPIFSTVSKEQPDPVVGLSALAEVRRRVSKPLVAIGGIQAQNLASVLRAGADTVAVLGAACRGDVEVNCKSLVSAAEEA